MPRIIVSGFNIRPPAGLTPGGKLHKFQQATVDRLTVATNEVTAKATNYMKARMAAAYGHTGTREATGRARESLRYTVKSDRTKGVSGRISIGSFREVHYLTNLGGGQFVGRAPYEISPNGSKRIVFWSRTYKRMFVGPKGASVVHPGFPAGDVLTESAIIWGDRFKEEVMLAVSRGITELTSGSAARANSAPQTRKYHR